MKRILVVEDDGDVGSLLEELLHRAGYTVQRAYSGTEAQLLLERARPDLVLLDLMLPGLSGEALLPQLSGTPVIVLSAKADARGKAALLLSGAADYMTKPFDGEELLARVALRLREAEGRTQVAPTLGRLTLDTSARAALVDSKPLRLTRTEYAVLHILLLHPRQILTKAQLLERLSLDTPDCTESSLKVHVSHLRHKLLEADAGVSIEAVWGIGFQILSIS